MPTDREKPTTTDYVVTALSPMLIMLMVGSLVFFLVEVLYEGKYSGRLLYTLFFFVLAAVLIARIAIESSTSRASGYGLALGIATFLALLSYVEYPKGSWLSSFGWLVNLGLMVLIWWSANKLTWDCTHIDEKRKGAGRGILSAAGLDTDAKEEGPDEKAEPASTKPESAAKRGTRRKGKKNKHELKLWDWIEKYKKHQESQRKGAHTPGVWVIYFALAALPLFALGQSLVDPEDSERRQHTFLQMAVYVGSALALLVTTSFLGLRRYLRQRKASIPGTMTASWLGFGGLLIVAFLALGAFLPRPHSEVPWFGIDRAGKSDRDASRYALNKGSAGKGEGAGGEKTKAGDGDATAKGGQPGGKGKGEKSGSGKGEKGKSGTDKNGKSDGKGDQDQGQGSGQDKSEQKGGEKNEENDSSRSGSSERDKTEDKDKSTNKDSSGGRNQTSSELGGMLEKVAQFVKWLVFAIVAVLVVIGVALAILRYLAPFTSWAQRLLDALKNWWANLFGGKGQPEKKSVKEQVPQGPVRPPPFSEFPNPFSDGSAERREVAELVDYTFIALDSWAWDRDCGRDPDETPLEFARRLGEAFPDLAELLNKFAKAYARVTYSELELPDDTREMLEATWEGMVYGIAVG